MRKKPDYLILILALCSVLILVGVGVLSAFTLYQTSRLKESILTLDGKCNTEHQTITQLINSLESMESGLEEQRQKLDSIQEQKNNAVQEDSEEAAVSNGKRIAIDPGHQGWHIDMSDTEPVGPGSSEMKMKATSGTSGTYSGLAEFELNLNVSKNLRDILEERGYSVLLTREDNDTAISNAERAQLATEYGADIYVRIHANGDDSHTVSGALTMVPSPSNPYVSYLADDSYRLGECILNAYCERTQFKNLGVQYYDNMTGINWSTVPVTIIEMGFMTHESDDLMMADTEFQYVMATGIANGIDAYFNSKEE